jgi:hypothetical protein
VCLPPELKVILLTGGSADTRGFPFLRKPFGQSDLQRVMADATGHFLGSLSRSASQFLLREVENPGVRYDGNGIDNRCRRMSRLVNSGSFYKLAIGHWPRRKASATPDPE